MSVVVVYETGLAVSLGGAVAVGEFGAGMTGLNTYDEQGEARNQQQ